jgi:hypothetical protein
LIKVSMAGGQENGDDLAAFSGELIAMRMRDFLDQAVGTQQGKFSSNHGGVTPALLWAFGQEDRRGRMLLFSLQIKA